MNTFKHLALVGAATLAFGALAGCKVEQTEEGDLPDVDVQVVRGVNDPCTRSASVTMW